MTAEIELLPLPKFMNWIRMSDRLFDHEGNPVRPVFSTDEIAPDEVCDDCFRPIKEN